ncbi:MAG: hypothetical protein O3B65_02005 [Chloroflexi bacterium]|nr:hypothetical protein [Chloroflexota bacterium]
MTESPADQPQIGVRPVGEAQGSGPWDVALDITNSGEREVGLLEAWLPHTILHGDAVDLSGGDSLGAGASVTLRFTATFEPRDPGEPSNPFLILRLLYDGIEWRVLARLAVDAGSHGKPVTSVAAITVHRVGFSEGEQ